MYFCDGIFEHDFVTALTGFSKNPMLNQKHQIEDKGKWMRIYFKRYLTITGGAYSKFTPSADSFTFNSRKQYRYKASNHTGKYSSSKKVKLSSK